MAGKDEEKKKRDKEAIKQLYTMLKQKGVSISEIKKAVENVQANAEFQQARFERFRAENVEKFNKFVDKGLAEEVKKAQARIGDHNGPNVAYVCQTLSDLYNFDYNSMKVKTIGSGKNKEVVVASDNGIAIGKGDKFYIATPDKGIAKLRETEIHEEYFPSGGHSIYGLKKSDEMLPKSDNVDVVAETLGHMKEEYAKMGFKSDFSKELEAAHGEAGAYQKASPEVRKQMDKVLAARTSKSGLMKIIGVGPMKTEVLCAKQKQKD